jgi:hypothetical protein
MIGEKSYRKENYQDNDRGQTSQYQVDFDRKFFMNEKAIISEKKELV